MRLGTPAMQELITSGLGGLVMGAGYTTGAYGGYGAWNTADPIGIHHRAKAYNRPQYINIEMAYGGYGYRKRYYGRRYRKRRYYRRYSRYNRRYYRRYSRYY